MGWLGMGRLFLVTFAANLALCHTQQQDAPPGEGEEPAVPLQYQRALVASKAGFPG